MNHRAALFIVGVVTAVVGCGPNGVNSKQPSTSDSTEDLAALLRQKDAKHPAMLFSRELSAIEILATRGDQAYPILLQVAQDPNEDKTLRIVATEAIGQSDQVPEDQIPVLFELRRGESGILVYDLLERSCKSASMDVVVPLLVEFVKNDKIGHEDRQSVALILYRRICCRQCRRCEENRRLPSGREIHAGHSTSSKVAAA